MSGLRYFDDMMDDLLARERRLQDIDNKADSYERKCKALRQEHLPRAGRPSPTFFAASEGLCAVNVILGSRS